jgi:hypothetical protein
MARRKVNKKLQERYLDFAKRMIFKGYDHLTETRKNSLWEDAEWFLRDCFDDGIRDWDQDKGIVSEMYACDWFLERFENKYLPSTAKWDKKIENGDEPKYYRMLSATCRATIDLLDHFAGGVRGWTIGDIKRMYDGTLPDWFDKGWKLHDDGFVKLQTQPDSDTIAI